MLEIELHGKAIFDPNDKQLVLQKIGLLEKIRAWIFDSQLHVMWITERQFKFSWNDQLIWTKLLDCIKGDTSQQLVLIRGKGQQAEQIHFDKKLLISIYVNGCYFHELRRVLEVIRPFGTLSPTNMNEEELEREAGVLKAQAELRTKCAKEKLLGREIPQPTVDREQRPRTKEQRAGNLLKNCKRALILGIPGSGKSVELMRMAYDMMEDGYSTSGAIPVFIPLLNIGEKQLPLLAKAEGKPIFESKTLDSMFEIVLGEVHDQVKYFFDGYDELNAEKQAVFWQKVEHLLLPTSKNHLLITSVLQGDKNHLYKKFMDANFDYFLMPSLSIEDKKRITRTYFKDASQAETCIRRFIEPSEYEFITSTPFILHLLAENFMQLENTENEPLPARFQLYHQILFSTEEKELQEHLQVMAFKLMIEFKQVTISSADTHMPLIELIKNLTIDNPNLRRLIKIKNDPPLFKVSHLSILEFLAAGELIKMREELRMELFYQMLQEPVWNIGILMMYVSSLTIDEYVEVVQNVIQKKQTNESTNSISISYFDGILINLTDEVATGKNDKVNNRELVQDCIVSTLRYLVTMEPFLQFSTRAVDRVHFPALAAAKNNWFLSQVDNRRTNQNANQEPSPTSSPISLWNGMKSWQNVRLLSLAAKRYSIGDFLRALVDKMKSNINDWILMENEAICLNLKEFQSLKGAFLENDKNQCGQFLILLSSILVENCHNGMEWMILTQISQWFETVDCSFFI